ncbi:neural-cadherin-like [Schistocerca gregaria]|uniref:neural-cadherin-like n=1 Tax=Schistocerca gregaria TaxID=7010 RepID=UPI00211E678D|nr:neural-cadherin-like [Schistocerca gregaria]
MPHVKSRSVYYLQRTPIHCQHAPRHLFSDDKWRPLVLQLQRTAPILAAPWTGDADSKQPRSAQHDRTLALHRSPSGAHHGPQRCFQKLLRDLDIHYQIEAGNEERAFSIDSDTGSVSVAGKLDFENRKMYELRLAAMRGQGPSAVGRAELLVTVLDVNDEPPVFQQAVYRAELQEEEDPAHLPRTILTVKAEDGDTGRPQDVVYSISGPGAVVADTDEGFFSVDANTGDVFVHKPLDRDPPDGRPLWRFTAFAQDEGGAGLVGYADVQVSLADVNDNAPAFPHHLYHGQVIENAPAGTFILNVTAEDNDDPDEGSNARVRYYIDKNAVDETTGSAIFKIDADTGEISTAICCLDRERTPAYSIQVVATDGGGLEGTATVSITVTDVNDTPPEFSKDEWFVEVNESDGGSVLEKPILTVTVRDQDEFNTLQYEVVRNSGYGSDKFSLERNSDGTASLKANKPLDYEDVHGNLLRFKIQVSDKNENDTTQQHHTTYSWVSVKLRDINDNFPVFQQRNIEVAISEDATVGKVIAAFEARDADQDGKSGVTYAIDQSSNRGRHFRVNHFGQVLLERELDREDVSRHVVNILAIDEGVPPKTSTATLTVIVKDVNDNAPHLLENYKAVLTENTSPKDIIEILGADSDDYSRNNGPPFTFKMDPIANEQIRSSFSVHFDQKGPNGHGSAIISSLRSFDREQQKEYLVPVLVIDSGYPPLTGTSTVKIIIGDINDNKMKFGRKNILVYKYKDQTPETDIGRVYVEDPDDWDLPDKKFFWNTHEHHRFRINEASGMITMKCNTPDGMYNLVFRVQDHKHKQNNVSAIVTVTVKHISHDAIINSGSLRISNLSDEDFIKEWNYMVIFMEESKAEQLKTVLSEVLNTQRESVDIFSVNGHRSFPPVLDIFFTIERKTKLDLIMAGIHYCFIDKINCQDLCIDSYRIGNHPVLVDANTTSLAGISVVITAKCNSATQNFAAANTCNEKHCYNGGYCIKEKSSVSCACPSGYKGPRCQQTVRSFQGSGWAWFQSIQPQAENHISVEFLTYKEDGLLFYNGPLSPVIIDGVTISDYIALELKSGEPRLLFHLAHYTTEIFIKVKKKLNDGMWHQIDLFWGSENVHLILDYCKSADVVELQDMKTSLFNGTSCLVKAKVSKFSERLNLNSPLQIGGIYRDEIPPEIYKWNASPNAIGFEGCIRNFYSNGQILDLADTLLSAGTVADCLQTKLACSTVNCSGHGVCQADFTERAPWCLCDAGWSGPSCSSPTQPVTFLPHSYIKFALSFEIGHFTTLMQLRFRTEEKDGELFRLADQQSLEYAVLEINNGNLYFRYNLNRMNIEEKYICLCFISVDDGYWHTAKVSRYGSLSILELDDGEFLRRNQTSLFEGHQWLVIDKQEGAHAGGKAEHTGINTLEINADYRNGCVDDIRLDGKPLPLPPVANVTQWGQATVALNLEFGCSFPSDCNSIICTEPVKCNDKLRQHKCM